MTTSVDWRLAVTPYSGGPLDKFGWGPPLPGTPLARPAQRLFTTYHHFPFVRETENVVR